MLRTQAKCRALSRSVERLCVASLAMQLATLAMLVPETMPAAPRLAPLALAWLAWGVLQVQNFRLVGCGNQARRLSLSPSFVNRPEFAIRMCFHLTINWSVLATSIAVAWRTHDTEWSRALALLAATAAVVVWISFNLLHRRMNRRRNLILSTSIAATLITAAVLLVKRS